MLVAGVQNAEIEFFGVSGSRKNYNKQNQQRADMLFHNCGWCSGTFYGFLNYILCGVDEAQKKHGPGRGFSLFSLVYWQPRYNGFLVLSIILPGCER